MLGDIDEQPTSELPEAAEAAPPALYKSSPSAALEQGDLLPRDSEVVQQVVAKYHEYHVRHAENELFAVLTQSCDLVPHDGVCKAKYISLAPVRTVKNVLIGEFEDVLVNTPGNLYTLGSEVTLGRYSEFLTKLINNNDSRHFFLPAHPAAGLLEDMCIILPLSIPIRIEHYAACLKSRVIQLDDLFQAKLGWLLGQQYSRVGTPDWPEKIVQEKVKTAIGRNLTWFPPNDFDQIKRMLTEFSSANPAKVVEETELASMVGKLKNRKQLAIDMVFALMDQFLEESIFPPVGPKRFQLRKRLVNSDEFAKFFPNS